MSLTDTLHARLFAPQIKRIKEETAAQLLDEVKQGHWRALSTSTIELPYTEHLQNQLDAIEAYRTNPMASRIVDLSIDFVLGQGVQISASPKYVDTFIKTFWHHKLNNMDHRLFSMALEIALTGELFVTFHANPYDGMTYIRTMPSTSINEITPSPNDPETPLSFDQVEITNVASPRTWYPDQMHYYRSREITGTLRGQGDLHTALPWLRRYKDWLTDRVIINKYKGAYLWDVTLTGATASIVKAKQNEIAAAPPTSGAVFVHNEAEVWKAIKPEIGADQVDEDGRALRMMIAAGTATPLHYLGEGSEYNRAVADSMAEPVRKAHQRRQRLLTAIVRDILSVAISNAQDAGMLQRSSKGYTITTKFPDLSSVDNLALAQATNQMAEAMNKSIPTGIITKEEAADWLRNVSQQQPKSTTPEETTQ
jgi:hypothetical protein